MIWRDSRGRFTRVPKTAITAVSVAVYPTSRVPKKWNPADTLDRASAAVKDALGGYVVYDTDDQYRALVEFWEPVSMDWLADALEFRSAAIQALDLGGARLHLLVRLKDKRWVPITKAYDKTDEILAESVYQLRRKLERYLPDDYEEDMEDFDSEPIELPPEPIRYNKRDAKGRFTK